MEPSHGESFTLLQHNHEVREVPVQVSVRIINAEALQCRLLLGIAEPEGRRRLGGNGLRGRQGRYRRHGARGRTHTTAAISVRRGNASGGAGDLGPARRRHIWGPRGNTGGPGLAAAGGGWVVHLWSDLLCQEDRFCRKLEIFLGFSPVWSVCRRGTGRETLC